MSRATRVLVWTALFAAAACTADSSSPTTPEVFVQGAIADAGHGGPVPGFYFLPPMVSNPGSFSGTFDPALQPTVEVCVVTAGACSSTVALFNFGGGGVTLNSDHYAVNWNTPANLDPNLAYRIVVRSGSTELGSADVVVEKKGGTRSNQYVTVKAGSTLPIRFRIETGIVGSVTVTPSTDSIPTGGTKQFSASCADLHGNPTACPTVTWSSSATAVATVSGSGLATGVAPGTTTITASIGYASGTATLKVYNPNTAPTAGNDAFNAIGNVTIPVAAPGVLANDTDAETPGGLSVVPGTVATTGGGTATLAADGSFSYLTAPGFLGSDSFSYTVTDGSLTATGTVTMTVASRVWYVDNSATAPGDGRDAHAFTALASAQGASASGETVFLRYGNGTSAGYDAGYSFQNGQSLIGQGVPANITAVVNSQTIVLLAAGSAPTVSNAAAGATLRLASNNTAQGMNVLSSAGAGVSGTGFGTFAAGSMNVAATGGPSLDLDGGSVSATIATLSSAASSGAGLRLIGVNGSLTAPGGVVTGAAGSGVDISGGSASVDYGGSINASATRAVSVTGHSGGAITLSGNLSDAAGGILVQGNTGGSVALNGASKSVTTSGNSAVTVLGNSGATVSFGGGGLTLATTGAASMDVSGGGTVTVTGAGNTISATGGSALRVVGAAIGAAGMSFRSIAASAAVNGIVLNGTGSAGGVQVTGNGAAASGGVIQGMSGDGVLASSGASLRLAWMVVQNNLGSGIHAVDVDGVRVEDSSVLANGDNAAADEAGIRFDNVTGTTVITNSTVEGSADDNVRVVSSTGTLSLTISNSVVRNNLPGGGDGVLLSAGGAAGITAVVQNNDLVNNRTQGLEATTTGGGTLDVTVQGGTVRNNNVGVGIVHGSSGALTFNVLNIPVITGQAASPINVNRLASASAASVFKGTISGNAIGTVGVPNSGASAGPGIRVISNGVGGTLTTLISNNTIREVANRGIDLLARDGSSTLNATITGNSIVHTAAISLEGIRFDAGALTTDAVTACGAISGNTITVVGANNGIRLRQRFAGTSFKLSGYPGSPTSDPAVVAYLLSTNTATTAAADHGGTGFTNAACPLP